MNVLIVIDMQPGFVAAEDPVVINAVKKEIIKAKEETNLILFVEYKWNGRTWPQLTNAVKDYSFTDTIKKTKDDGAEDIMNYFQRCRIAPKKLRVIGVNSDACVLATLYSLYTASCYKLEVVKAACNSTSPKHEIEECYSDLRKLGIKVI